jgi:DNA repair exonuclease SbcCD ATPase subunit
LKQSIAKGDRLLHDQVSDVKRQIQTVVEAIEPRLAKQEQSLNQLKATAAKQSQLTEVDAKVEELRVEFRRVDRLEELVAPIPQQIQNLTATAEQLVRDAAELRADVTKQIDRLARDTTDRFAKVEKNQERLTAFVEETRAKIMAELYDPEKGSLSSRVGKLEHFQTHIQTHGAPPDAETRMTLERLAKNQVDKVALVERFVRLETAVQTLEAAPKPDPELPWRVEQVETTLNDHISDPTLHHIAFVPDEEEAVPEPEPEPEPEPFPGQQEEYPTPEPFPDPGPWQPEEEEEEAPREPVPPNDPVQPNPRFK